MKKLFMLLMVIGFVGCGGSNFQSNEVVDYLDKFQQETCIDVSDVNVTVCDATPDNRAGYTTVGFPKIILLLNTIWNNLEDYQKEVLISHELMHYKLGIINHNNKLNSESEPESIMNEYIYNRVSEIYWDKHKKEYYKPFIQMAKQHNKLIKNCIPIWEQ